MVCSLENELAHARQQNELTVQLSKELASAQRDIRELRRKTSVQSLLRGAHSRSTAPGAARLSNSIGRADETVPSAPVSPSSTSSRSSTSSTPVSQQPETLKTPPPTPRALLARCPNPLLMRVFAFLDANSVFAVSLTSHALQSRVHGLFGVAPSTTTSGKRTKRTQATLSPPPPSLLPASASSQSTPRLQSNGRSQSFVTQSEKEKAQVRTRTEPRCSFVYASGRTKY